MYHDYYGEDMPPEEIQEIETLKTEILNTGHKKPSDMAPWEYENYLIEQAERRAGCSGRE